MLVRVGTGHFVCVVYHIIEDGTYETQVYYRSLTETGMDLIFSRYRDGERPKAISVIARRVSK